MEENDINLNLYKIFLSVYETKSISKTAERLFVSQPSVSYSIKVLEKTLGVSLFFRKPKGVVPTSMAIELYSYIKNAVDIINSGQRSVKETKELIKGDVYVGVQTHIGRFFLIDYIEKFNKLYPNIKFHIKSKSTNELVKMLEEGEIDVMIDSLPINVVKSSLIVCELLVFNSGFAASPRYLEKIGNRTISIEELTKYPLILPSAGSTTRNELERIALSNNINLNPIIEAYTTEMIVEFTARELGIGYFIKDFVKDYINSGQLAYIPVNEELPKTTLCLVYKNKPLSNTAKKFIEILKG